MCTTCGCGSGQTKIEGEGEHTHVHADGTMHSHPHTHGVAEGGHDHAHHDHRHHGHEHLHEHQHEHVHADGTRHAHAHSHAHGLDHDHAHETDDQHAAHAHAPGLSAAQKVRIERDILAANDEIAARNRRRFEAAGIFALNLVSSPGAGKTTLLVETIRRLDTGDPLVVIEGDQQTRIDADRIRATGCKAIQVNTGKGCHLDASQIERALEALAPAEDSLLFIENVGNLVCPAAFDLGEAHKVVVLSVTEGEDKPLKYPDMFAAARLLLLAKIDLLPHVAFDVQRTIDYARRVQPDIEVLQVSATSGAGMDQWVAWVRRGAEAARERRRDNAAALKRSAAERGAQAVRSR